MSGIDKSVLVVARKVVRLLEPLTDKERNFVLRMLRELVAPPAEEPKP